MITVRGIITSPTSPQLLIRGGKESITLHIAVCKHPLESTEVKLTKIVSANITVMGKASRW